MKSSMLLLTIFYRYIVDLNVTKGNLSYKVVDYVGDTLEATVLSNGSVKFTLDEDWDAVSLAGVTEEQDVELSYRAKVFPAPESTTTTQAPTASPTGNLAYSVQPMGALVVACAIAVVWR
ncbi:hypothetical protein N7474_001565 [Penicillium riverlandense]|uniref:uncharacterized protein n=1 Tax=Penicillium riverlandense TaxID=1903569 RepID=UPI002546C836|nr:uncharacterized protein N7474_001565 [Penicillium riverlandense]KAJ5833254.1 hypothetical protein N7474_001565 [Penicillium riverlandense]